MMRDLLTGQDRFLKREPRGDLQKTPRELFEFRVTLQSEYPDFLKIKVLVFF